MLKPGGKKQFYPNNKCIFLYVFYPALHLKLYFFKFEAWIKKKKRGRLDFNLISLYFLPTEFCSSFEVQIFLHP